MAAQIGSRVVLADKARVARKRDGGAPVAADGAAYIVVGGYGRYESVEQNEDMGDMSGPGWQVVLYLRRASDVEARPAREQAAQEAARAAAQALRNARIQELTRLCEAGMLGEADCPRGSATYSISEGVHGSGRKIAVLSDDCQGVAIWCSGFDQALALAAAGRRAREPGTFTRTAGDTDDY